MCSMTMLKMMSWFYLTSQAVFWKIASPVYCQVLQLQQVMWDPCLLIQITLSLHLLVFLVTIHWWHKAVAVTLCLPCLPHVGMPTKLNLVPHFHKAILPSLIPHRILWKKLSMSFLAAHQNLVLRQTRLLVQQSNWMLTLD